MVIHKKLHDACSVTLAIYKINIEAFRIYANEQIVNNDEPKNNNDELIVYDDVAIVCLNELNLNDDE